MKRSREEIMAGYEKILQTRKEKLIQELIDKGVSKEESERQAEESINSFS